MDSLKVASGGLIKTWDCWDAKQQKQPKLIVDDFDSTCLKLCFLCHHQHLWGFGFLKSLIKDIAVAEEEQIIIPKYKTVNPTMWTCQRELQSYETLVIRSLANYRTYIVKYNNCENDIIQYRKYDKPPRTRLYKMHILFSGTFWKLLWKQYTSTLKHSLGAYRRRTIDGSVRHLRTSKLRSTDNSGAVRKSQWAAGSTSKHTGTKVQWRGSLPKCLFCTRSELWL